MSFRPSFVRQIRDAFRSSIGDGSGGAPPVPAVFFREFIETNYSTGLIYHGLSDADPLDLSPAGNDPASTSGLATVESEDLPKGFETKNVATFNGSSSVVRLEPTGGPYPFGLSAFTVSGWFKKTGNGDTFTTAGGTDGWPSASPLIPLLTKGRGESEASNKDANWVLGISSDGDVLGADFEHAQGDSPNNHKVVGVTTIANDVWYFASLTWDGTDFSLFLNGVFEAKVTPTGFTPRSDSIQPAAIGRAYNSSGTADGAFEGEMADQLIWGIALDEADLLAIYNKGVEELRVEVVPDPAWVVTLDAEDDHIDHGTDFANWTVDAGSSKDATGITITQGAGVQAVIDIVGLVDATDYWMKIVVAAESASAGNIRVVALADTGQEIAGPAGALINVPDGPGTYYLKVTTDVTPAVPGQHRLVLKHASASAGETIRMSEIVLYPIPARSAAKMIVMGDREGGWTQGVADIVDAAMLHANADALTVLQSGDAASTANSFAALNDALKTEIVTNRGGEFLPVMGNHDHDADREDDWAVYFGVDGYNAGRFYYHQERGECFIGVFDDNNETDSIPFNAGGHGAASAAAHEASVAAQYVIDGCKATTQPWKIAMIHRAPYSSNSSGGDPQNRLNFAGAGFDVVIGAHYHGLERLHVGGVLHYTCARGGGNHHGWGSTHPDSEWKEDDQGVSAYLKIYDSEFELVFEMLDTDQNLIDRVKLTRELVP